MKKNIFDFLKRGGKNAPAERKEAATVHTDFIKGISFEEDPFKGENPTETIIYDLDGNEVEK